MTDTDTDLQPGARNDGLVNVLLAHPLNADRDLTRLGLPPDTPCNVGDIVTVDRWQAQSLIGAGLAQVDPEDNAAVSAYLTPGVAPTEDVEADFTGDQQVAVDPGGVDDHTHPVAVAEPLVGEALDKALDEAGLSKSGKVAEKQARLAAHVANPQPADGASDPA